MTVTIDIAPLSDVEGVMLEHAAEKALDDRQ